MKTLKEYIDNFNNDYYSQTNLLGWNIDQEDAYKQGFIDATRLAAENAEVLYQRETLFADGFAELDKQSILKAIE